MSLPIEAMGASEQPEYPYGTSAADFAKYPKRFREDAVLEAWRAYLGDEDPMAAAGRYVRAERRHEKNEIAVSQRVPGLDVHDLPMSEDDFPLRPEDMGLHLDSYHGWCRDDI